ncbi:MAG TPA: ABC transporter ATP-binding protein/permease [Candidatus Gallimonas intestinigallinarum]|uniref:ABC transporter ATP-binding protein/permease n=1 Tax=Candidatus Gallimonas intestinigallinarum TaxID=2838604 RepID=A0A9D2IVJ2_9FIRM|nr:ABC transporter ATP-binding protein/permease [Candidatus Gallimonas intestinigallinarum]
MLKLSEITKEYKVASGTVHALKGVSLAFRENEFVCVLGPSGCGKTTLLNIIGGLDHYTTGDLVIQGRSTKHFRDRDWDVYRNHRIGFIFQSYNLIPHQTVLGNVELALTIAGVGREERKERAKQALERVGLGNELDKKPNQLSGGQMQRVAIARALVNNPDILLADEPTGALDSETSVQIMELIKEIAGDRLVIMVTHNPELAYQYASRIVRLKDGLVESDSAPYEEEGVQTAEVTDEAEHAPSSQQEAPQTGKKKKKLRARMSFLTSLALSARNLLTKKGRTILTSVAGSIGIISVCLVLALSNGFNNYIRQTEEDMLSYYPVTISESSFDLASVMTSFTSPQDMPDMSRLDDKVYIDSFLTSLANGMAATNNISDEYVAYLEAMDSSWYSEIMYSYGASISDNLFLQAETFPDGDNTATELTTRSLSNLKSKYITDLMAFASQYSSLIGFADYFTGVVNVMPGTSDNANQGYGEYVKSQYDIVAGTFPQNENEAVLVVGQNNQVTDLTLAQLGLLSEDRFMDLFNLGDEDAEVEVDEDADLLDISDILGKEYKLFYNDAVYTRNEDWTQMSYFGGQYPFTYQGQMTDDSAFHAEGDDGINIKITCILRLNEDYSYGCLSPGLNITEKTGQTYIRGNLNSAIVNWMKSDEAKLSYGGTDIYLMPVATENMTGNYTLYEIMGQSVYVAQTPDDAIKTLGGSDIVSRIAIYANDFDNKELVLNYLDQWNTDHDYSDEARSMQITYTDTVGMLMSIMQTMIDIITYVLVAFTAISLIVSSVMIGIITYVSVVERVKEIGVLRSLGARKQDIRNLFNAETFIIGLAAGLIGIAISYVLCIVISLVLESLTGIGGIASLPALTAFIMVCVSVVLTLISGLIPAQSAAKKDPVIALRSE